MNLFPTHEPRAGGLNRLRARLDGRAPRPRWIPAGAALLATAMVLAILVGRARLAPAPLEVRPSAAAYALGLVKGGSDAVLIDSSLPVQPLSGVAANVQVYAMVSLGDSPPLK